MKNLKKKLNDFFEIDKRNSNIKVEIFAGIATFLAMAYILIVNPNNILWEGPLDPRFSSVFIATALGAFLGTLLMALLANIPLAQAPGMGLNAMIGTLLGGALGFSFSYGNAMLIVLLSGIVFFALSIIPAGYDEKSNRYISLREKIFDGLPVAIRKAIPVGIGLFITFIGLQNAKIIVGNEFTLLSLVDFNNYELWQLGGPVCSAFVALFGLIVISVLSHYKVKGSIIIGVLSSTILAIPLKVANFDILLGKVDGISWQFWQNFATFFSESSANGGIFFSVFKEGFNLPSGSLLTCIMMVITFCMIDMFDTMGTVVACCTNAKLIDKDGKPYNYDKIMYADSTGTLLGAFLGTSTVTTFVESSAGVAEGGKTGLTALVTAFFFLLSIFLLPLFAFIPSASAASALIYVGVLMMKNVFDIDFSNVKVAVPSFLTIIIMVLAYSITDGIGIGIISYFVIDIIIYIIDFIKYKQGKLVIKPKTELNIVTGVVLILFLIYFLIPTVI